MRKRHYLRMYKSKWHLLMTALILTLPILIAWTLFQPTDFDSVSFLVDLLYSTMRLVAAFILSLFMACLLGLTLSRGKLGDFFLPFFDVLQSFPTFAMLPLAVHYFGESNLTVLFFLVLTIIWPILFAIISSVRLVRGELEEAATIYGATGWRRLVYFSLPVSYPGIVTGSIVGLGEGWEAVVGAEIIISLANPGLGGFFSTRSTHNSEVVFGVFALLFFIFALNKIIWLPLLEKSHKLLSE